MSTENTEILTPSEETPEQRQERRIAALEKQVALLEETVLNIVGDLKDHGSRTLEMLGLSLVQTARRQRQVAVQKVKPEFSIAAVPSEEAQTEHTMLMRQDVEGNIQLLAMVEGDWKEVHFPELNPALLQQYYHSHATADEPVVMVNIYKVDKKEPTA
jgi:RNA processing factor Prp31